MSDGGRFAEGSAGQVDFNDLNVFAVVAHAGSLRQAAARLRMSQPWVSQRITRLETTLGVELVARSTRGIELTDAGRRLLPYLARGMELMHDAIADVQAATPLAALSVWTDSTLAPVVMPFVHKVLRRHPVRLSNRTAEVAKTMRAIANGDADVGFCPEQAVAEGVEAVPFFRDRLGVVVHPDHPLAAAGPLSVADLAGHPVAVTGSRTGVAAALGQLTVAGVPSEAIRVVQPASTALMLASYCAHVGVCARSSVMAPVEAGWLVEIEVEDVPAWSVEVHLVHRTADAEQPPVAALRRAVERAWDLDDICARSEEA